MTFSGQIKSELCKINNDTCCRIAECYGMLLFSRNDYENNVFLKTESKETAERFIYFLRRNFGIIPAIFESGSIRKTYYVKIIGAAERKKVLNFYRISQNDSSIDFSFLKHQCCNAAFLRGIFLSCGTVMDPEKGYHLELSLKSQNLSNELLEFLAGFLPIPKKVVRKSAEGFYYKDSDTISDFLTFIGATQFSLEMIGVKILNDMKLTVSRRTNCETANLAKTADAVIKQLSAIEYLEKTHKFELLPQELKEVAKLRKAYPEASLSELLKLSGNKITRSGLNHRINRLIEAAERAKQGNN